MRRLVLAAALLAAVPGRARAAECVAVATFSSGRIGEFPPDWTPRKEAGRGVYSIREEGALRFLHAAAKGLGIQAAKEIEWNLDVYPVLAWSWRPVEFPQGADERKSSRNDSALAVYAVFPHSPASVKSLKYIWSAVVPMGTHLTSSGGLTQARVLRSGTQGQGQWSDEQVNVVEDYRRYFGGEAPRPAGISVLTDSDDTKGSAQGDYANFRVCKP